LLPLDTFELHVLHVRVQAVDVSSWWDEQQAAVAEQHVLTKGGETPEQIQQQLFQHSWMLVLPLLGNPCSFHLENVVAIAAVFESRLRDDIIVIVVMSTCDVDCAINILVLFLTLVAMLVIMTCQENSNHSCSNESRLNADIMSS